MTQEELKCHNFMTKCSLFSCTHTHTYTLSTTHTWSNSSTCWSTFKGRASIKIEHSCTQGEYKQAMYARKHNTTYIHMYCYYLDNSWACSACAITSCHQLWLWLCVGEGGRGGLGHTVLLPDVQCLPDPPSAPVHCMFND